MSAVDTKVIPELPESGSLARTFVDLAQSLSSGQDSYEVLSMLSQRTVEVLPVASSGILITDHNVQETLSITDRAYLLFEGKILKSGTAEELSNDDQVRKVYLGQKFVLRK